MHVLLLLTCLAAGLGAQPAINTTILRADATAPSAAGPLAPAFARAKAAVVQVLVEITAQNTFAIERPSSGVVLTEDGLVLTHWDLVREAENAPDKKLFVVLGDAARTRLPAGIVAHDDASGLALLQVALPAERKLVALGLAADPSPGDPALVFGLPDGEDGIGFAGVITPAVGSIAGPASAGARVIAREDLVLTDAAIQARSHGAALVSASGGLIGLCSAARVLPEVAEPTLQELKRPSFGYAVPSRVIERAFPTACARVARAPAVASREARAVAAVATSIVSVFGGKGARPPLGTDDPYATQRRPGVGSGVIVDSTGLVFTNLHLVQAAEAVTVTLAGGKSWPADVLQTDPRTNTALLKVRLEPGAKVPPIRCGSVADVAVGQRLLAVGNPEGDALTVRAGVLSAKRGPVLQLDAGIGNHNGGGAIVTLDGVMVALADSGPLDAIDVAFEHRGEQAKVDSGLDLSPSLDLLVTTYRAALDRHAGSNPALTHPGTNADAAAAAAPSPDRSVARTVERTAGSLLNVYVQITTRAEELEDNPFATATGPTITEGLGSGVVIDASGLALTNWHVVDSATLPNGAMRPDRVVRASRRDGKTFLVTVLSISREEDLALLQLELGADDTVEAVALGQSAALAVGDAAIAIGNPHGRANTVTAGVVTAKNRAIRVNGRWRKLRHLLETDAAINAGNSGGALLDSEGRLIGINSAGGSRHAVTGFAIGVDHVREKLRTVLLAPEKLRSAYPGVSVLDHDGKVVVQAVDRYGPAAAAGLEVDDVLCAVRGEPVRWSVGWALAWLRPVTEAVAVEIERGGVRATKHLTPWSAATFAVYRQTSVQVGELSQASDAGTVRAAAVAAARCFTGDPDASPSELPVRVVRVVSVHPALAATVDLRAGDIVLGVAVRQAGRTGDAEHLHRFERVAELQAFFNEASTYDGEAFTTWVYRQGNVHVVRLTAKRVPW